MIEGVVRSEEIKGRHGLMVKMSLNESYLRIGRKIRKARRALQREYGPSRI